MCHHLTVVDVELRRPLGRRCAPRLYRSPRPIVLIERGQPRQAVARQRRALKFGVAVGSGPPIPSRFPTLMDRVVLPKGTWHLLTFIALTALFAVHGVARAQSEPPAEPTEPPEQALPPTLVSPPETDTPIAIESPAGVSEASSPDAPLEAATTVAASEPTEPAAIGNADVQEMVAAAFSDS